MKPFLINLSGHPVLEEVRILFEKTFSFPISNVDLSSEETVSETAKNLVKEMLGSPEIEEAVFRGEYEILLPDSPVLAVVMVTLLTKVAGISPTIRWMVRTEKGLVLSPNLDLQDLRPERSL